MLAAYSYDFPCCTLTITQSDFSIVKLVFGEDIPPGVRKIETEMLRKTAVQLYEYFTGERFEFNVPSRIHGTPFLNCVKNALLSISYGETRSYKDVARICGNPGAARAVGMACNRNPLPILIPCHRVIGADGSLTGYAGGIVLKERLLVMEHTKAYKRYP